MNSTLVSGFIELNMVFSAAVLAVLVLRLVIIRYFGGEAAYALWALVPASLFALVVPPRTVTVEGHPFTTQIGGIGEQKADTTLVSGAEVRTLPNADLLPEIPGVFAGDMILPLLIIWGMGAALMIAMVIVRQRNFMKLLGQTTRTPQFGDNVWQTEAAHVGPAVVGLLKPKIIVPKDFGARYSEDEQAMVLAHERVHLGRGDVYVNGLCIIISCVLWVNPLVHLAIRQLRMDQELACDGRVLRDQPGNRKIYGEALLKAFLHAPTLPMGCQWGPKHPMKNRLQLLARAGRRSRYGAATIASLTLGAGTLAWASQPPEIEPVEHETSSGSSKPILFDSMSADQLIIRNAPAIVEIIAEPRATYAIDVFPGADRPSGITPAIIREGPRFVFDGGYAAGPNLCTGEASERDSAPYLLRVRVPMTADIQLKDSLLVTISETPSGSIALGDCVIADLTAVPNTLDMTLADEARASVGSVDGQLTLSMTDEASFSAAAVIGVTDMDMIDSTRADFETVIGKLTGNLRASSFAHIKMMLGDTLPAVSPPARLEAIYPGPAEE